jgi:uncharacterized protein YlxW (UPF0749 family)
MNPAKKARLARIGLIGILLICLELLILQAWKHSYALEHQHADLTEEKDTLARAMTAQQQRLNELESQLRSLEKLSAAKSPTGERNVTK